MRFADYFKGAIAYGESLGLRNGTEQQDTDILVELSEPKQYKRGDGISFYPTYLIVWESDGIAINDLGMINHLITIPQQLKLVSMFVSDYEQYLADKKEPVAADSSK